MKTNILLAFALFATVSLFAQDMEFTTTPVILNDVPATEFEGVGHSFIRNTAAVDRTIRWDMSAVEITNGWGFAFCDKNLCYGESTLTEQFDIAPDEEGRMDVHVYLNNREGNATIEVTATDLADESLQVTNLYYFNNDPTSTQDIYRTTIKVYPNPSNGLFSVKGEKAIDNVDVYSLTGTKVRSFSYGDGQWYDISDLPRGTYMVRLVDRNGQQMVTKLVNKL